MITKAKDILKSVFGYSEFRTLQEEVIKNVLAKRDTLVIMPTGGGKSLCYQIPALIFDGLTIVISPLISLMKDQVEQLTELGASAVVLNSSLSPAEYEENIKLIKEKKAKMLYVAPETLMMERTMNLLSSLKVDCLTIDEAHCISEWGHDFRPEYRQLADVRSRFPEAVTVALTATATPRVQQDITRTLRFSESNVFIASFNRENLFLQVIRKNDPFEQTLKFLKKRENQSGIIYCFSRKQVDELYEQLHYLKFSVRPYHAGLSDAQRKRHQELFIKDDVQIIVATIAFGMGINKPNVRFVIHYDLPKNIESYYQEIGRAGRDGLNADCLLLFGYGDIAKINYFIDQKENEKERRIAKQHLNDLINYAEFYDCRRKPLLNYFGENYDKENCGMCDNCTKPKEELVDITIAAQKFLSCVVRTGEYFGAMHIVDILRGSKSQKVLEKRHDALSTYGIGKEYSKEQWLHLSHQFLVKNILKKDYEFGSLKVTEKGREVLRSKKKVFGKLKEAEISSAPKESLDLFYDKELFEILRLKRKEIADRLHFPPYVIFPDKTLIEMAARYPTSTDMLISIHGVGAVKLKKYGKAFVETVAGYLEKHPEIQTNPDGTRLKLRKKSLAYLSYAKAYKNAKSINKLLSELNVKLSTLLKHLYTYVLEGKRLDDSLLLNETSLSKDELKKIFSVFDRIGFEALSPVFEEFNKSIDYDNLHIARIIYVNRSNK
ncbi:MAG: DNA helicase RecQ [Chlorobi bacterium]|nr:DNA helicase RecQ [Chlorobiota bacterium]